MQDTVIQTWGLTKQYSGQGGCHDVTLEVPRGVVYGFIGPNGAGKSTFVRTLMGLLHPTSGRAEILGQPSGTVESRIKVGYLPELFRYQDWLTGKQLLEVHADLAGVPRVDRKNRIKVLIERVGLSGWEHQKIRNYSKGMQQRIGLAAALISDPEVIFLDEPTSALDPIGRRDVRDLITELRNQGKTVFLNSHLLAEVENLCDQVAIINKGKVVAQGDWRTLCDINIEVILRAESLNEQVWLSFGQLIKAARLLPDSDLSGTRWQIQCHAWDAVPEIIRLLCERGIAIYEVTPIQPHLEEVFMYWVERKERENVTDH